MTLIAFSRMMQAVERSTPSRSETIIKDSWASFDDPELLTKIMALEYEEGGNLLMLVQQEQRNGLLKH
jgi:hypothetical protein